MKKISVLPVLLVLIFQAKAQLSYGVRAATTISKIRFSNSGNSIDHKPVVFGGVFGNYRFSKKISAQLDILGFIESSKTKNFKTAIISGNKELVLRMPLMIQYTVAKGVRIGTGPQVGFTVKKDHKPADRKWTMVAGYQIPFVKGLGVNAKYAFSINKMAMRNLHSGVLQFGISYSITRKTAKA